MANSILQIPAGLPRRVLFVDDRNHDELMRCMARATAALTAQASFATAAPVQLEPGAATGDGSFDIQWMPPGPQAIGCYVTRPGQPQKPEVVKFTVQARHAEIFNRQLQAMLAAARNGEDDEPFFDFNHEDGMASGHPTELYWAGTDPKKGGIRARGSWTGSGRDGIRNGDWRRFSPQWEFDGATGEPLGIGANLGGLVNRAAFKQMARVAAKLSDAGEQANNDRKTNTKHMDRNEFLQWLSEGLKPVTDRIGALETKVSAQASGAEPGKAAATAQAAAAQPSAAEIATAVTTALDKAIKPINDRLQQFDTAEKDRATAAAKAVVQGYVDLGAIAPEDTKRIEFWQGQVLANAQAAKAELDRLPRKRVTPLTRGTGSSAATGAFPEDRITAAAKEAMKTNASTPLHAAMAGYLATPAGNRDYEEYRASILAGDQRFPTKEVTRN